MKKRIVTALLALSLCVGGVSTAAFAADVPPQDSLKPMQSSGSDIVPYADVIETYYWADPATGKIYKRRWNATRNYWVDSYWIPIG